MRVFNFSGGGGEIKNRRDEDVDSFRGNVDLRGELPLSRPRDKLSYRITFLRALSLARP